MMREGLLWFDDDPRRPFEQKVEEAVERYVEKFGETPNACFVNPRSLPENVHSHAGVVIRAAPTVLPNHFLVGISRTEKDGKRRRRGASARVAA